MPAFLTTSPACSRPRRRSAFTLMEILLVVAILVTLIAISMFVGGAVKRSMAAKSTRTTLQTMQNLMRDYLKAGNPEPQVPASWPYSPINHPSEDRTNVPSDPVNWVRALRATDSTGRLGDLVKNDRLGNPVVLDGFGNAIRYVPAVTTGTQQREGFFQSAGPDGIWLDGLAPPPNVKLQQDDLKSTDPT